MAQRDYVKKKSKAKSNSRIIPNLMMAIAVILVVMFAAILYFVSTNNVNKHPSSAIITEKPKTTLPDKPIERWTYLKALENPNGIEQKQSSTQSTHEKERQQILDNFMNDQSRTNQLTTNTQIVQNDAAVSLNHNGSWLLQCGAFKDKTNAESLKAKIAMLGVTSFIKYDSFYRVFVGPYTSKDEGERSRAMLVNNSISSCRMISQ